MGNPTPPGSGIQNLIDEIKDLKRQVRELSRPGGTQRASSLAYLSSLVTVADTSPSFNTGTVLNDGVIHWYAATPDLNVTVDIPTGAAIVEVTAGEASVTGGLVEAFCTFSVRDSAGTLVPGFGVGSVTGRFYQALTEGRLGVGIRTPRKPVIVDLDTYVGPFTIRGFFGFWSATSNTGDASAQFNDLSLVVQVIGGSQ